MDERQDVETVDERITEKSDCVCCPSASSLVAWVAWRCFSSLGSRPAWNRWTLRAQASARLGLVPATATPLLYATTSTATHAPNGSLPPPAARALPAMPGPVWPAVSPAVRTRDFSSALETRFFGATIGTPTLVSSGAPSRCARPAPVPMGRAPPLALMRASAARVPARETPSWSVTTTTVTLAQNGYCPSRAAAARSAMLEYAKAPASAPAPHPARGCVTAIKSFNVATGMQIRAWNGSK